MSRSIAHPFAHRLDAGQQLARALSAYHRRPDVLVLGLPRGGVPVAYAVASALQVPLDVFVVRKLGLPEQPELAMGALASGGVRVINQDVVQQLRVPQEVLDAVTREEARELQRREQLYRGEHPPADPHGKTILLVDDGLATGSTMRAAIAAVRRLGPAKVIVAVPVGARSTCALLENEADAVVCLEIPSHFHAVGQWYDDFSPTTDAEVRDFLRRADKEHAMTTPHTVSHAAMSETLVRLNLGPAALEGNLVLPENAAGLVMFAHGSGSSQHSPRNRMVARELNHAGFATLLLDLLTAEEEEIDSRISHLRFDIEMLAERLVRAAEWASHDYPELHIGLFGASTGAGAALLAAAARPEKIHAVVSRGGRPDLAAEALERVKAPTLLIVGGADTPVIGLNQKAFARLHCEKELSLVPGATHLFEEPGTLEQVAHLAGRWFERHLHHAKSTG